MSAMVDKGGGAGGRDVLNSYNPPPSYASVLSGRRAQSFFGGTPPLFPKRNSSVESRKDSGRREKQSVASGSAERVPLSSQTVQSTSSQSASASTSGNVSAATATPNYRDNCSPYNKPVERMDESSVFTPEGKQENQTLIPEDGRSFEKTKIGRDEYQSSRSNVEEKPSLDSPNFEPSRNRRAPYQERIRSSRGRDEPNEKRHWSPAEAPHRRNNFDYDDAKKSQYVEDRNVNSRYREETRAVRYDNLEDKENLINSDKRKSYLTDQDGWLTKVPMQKKAKNEKPFQQHPKTRFVDAQRYSGQGQQRPVGPRPFQQGRGRDPRREYQGTRQTIVYSNSRGSAFGKRQSTRGYQPERSFNTVVPKTIETPNLSPSLSTSSASVISTSGISSPGSTVVINAVPPKPETVLPQPIVITSTTVCRPDLTPPPPPACGTFSYRDILTKGIQSPPTPVKDSKRERRRKPEQKETRPERGSRSSERNTSEPTQSSPALKSSRHTSQAAQDTLSTSFTNHIVREQVTEDKVQKTEPLELSATQPPVSISTEVLTTVSDEMNEQRTYSSRVLAQRAPSDTSQTSFILSSDEVQPDQLGPGHADYRVNFIPALCQASEMSEVPPGFQKQNSDSSNVPAVNTTDISVPHTESDHFELGLEGSVPISTMNDTRSLNQSRALEEDFIIEHEMVQKDEIHIQGDRRTRVEEHLPSECHVDRISTIEEAELPCPRDANVTGYLHQKQKFDQSYENPEGHSVNDYVRLREPKSPVKVNTLESCTANFESGPNEAPSHHFGAVRPEVVESSGQFGTVTSSISPVRVSETQTSHSSEVNSESTELDQVQQDCESCKLSPVKQEPTCTEETSNLTRTVNISLVDNELCGRADAEEFATSKRKNVASTHSQKVEIEGEVHRGEPLSAGELLQQIQTNQKLFANKGVILNRVQENLSFPIKKKKITDRAPAPPPTPNDESYSGGWGSTPVDDSDPEGSPFQLISSAARELEHQAKSASPKESPDSQDIALEKDEDHSEGLNENFDEPCGIDNSKSESETVHPHGRHSIEPDTFSDFKTDSTSLNEGNEEPTFEKSISSSQDQSYNFAMEHDVNNNTVDSKMNFAENVQDLQTFDAEAETSQQTIHPTIIKPLSKLEAYFPNASQTWTDVPSNEPQIENTGALPQRTPKPIFGLNNQITQSSDERKEELGCTQANEGIASQIEANLSNELEKNYKVGEPEAVKEIEQSPVSSNREWLKSEQSSMSTDIYSSMNEDPTTSESCQVTSTTIAESIKSFTSGIQSSIPSNPHDIWSTNQSNPSLTLPNSNLLTMERPETSPLETLLKNSPVTSINLSTVNYFKDKSSKISVTAQAPIPFTSAPLHIATVTTPKEQRPHVGSGSDAKFGLVSKVPDVPNQPAFMPSIPIVGQQSVSSNSQELYHLMQQRGSNVMSGKLPNISSAIPSAIPSLMQNPGLNPYPHQIPPAVASQMSVPAQEIDYQQFPRVNTGQNTNVPPQQPHLNYVQPPAAPLQYPSMFDPRWSNSYSVDVNQSEWLNINRFPNAEREFVRPPQIHPLSQPVNLFNYPPPSMPPPKDGIFPNFNYPPPTFQPGYRLQTVPGFLQRPPPPLPPQYNSGYYNRAMDTTTSLHPPLRESPNRRDQSFGSVRNKLDSDRTRQTGHLQNQYQDIGNKASPNESYTNQFGGAGNMNPEHNSRYDANHGNKLQRPGTSRQPHDPTLADYIPRNLDAYNKNQAEQETSFNSSWKQKNFYNDKRTYGSSRRNFKPEHKDEVPYPPLPSTETYPDSENQLGGSRRKTPFKGNLPASEPGKGNKPIVHEVKPNVPMDYHKHEKSPMQMPYSNPNEMFMAGQAYPSAVPSLEFGPNQIAYGYADNSSDQVIDKMNNSVVDYGCMADKQDCDDSQLSHPGSPFDNLQDFCSGGWKYYHETITAPSGLRIHQSTYVPYPNPCGSMTTAYLSTNDVRARIQWLGFKKANELYTAKINAQRSLRMDVTVVCSKGGAVCCNSDILGTCSAYFHDRLFGRTDEYITIFVNVPSKIMKHFLQMMSCGEVFVPINDVNEVIMKAPIYLNLTM